MSDSPFWNDDWMRTQQQYWDQWTEMSRKAMGVEKPQTNPWEAAMDHWWKALSPSAPSSSQAFMEKMLDQGKLFFRLGDEVSKNLSQAQDWSDALNQTFEKMQASFAAGAEQTTGAAEKGFSQWIGFWEGPMESWRKAAGSLPMNSDMAGMPNMFEKLLGAPGLGFTREDEERYKDLGQSWIHYQHALSQYNQFFANFGSASVRCMQDKIKQMAEKEQRIESARGLYDVWVAACEEEYAKHAMTPEYAKVHGELVNALMGFKKRWGEIVDNRLGALGMPTTREVRTLQSRLQASRREVRAMRTELDLLKEQVAQLRAPISAPASVPTSASEPAASPAETSTPVAKKTTVRKTTTKKKVAASKTPAK